jgi:hypothetical protein
MLSSEGGAGGSSVCDDGEDGSGLDMSRLPEPTIAIGTPQRPNFEVVQVAQPIQLCLWRFRSDAPVQVPVSYPDGRVAASSGTAYVNWAAVPGDPGTVRVVDATERRLLVVGNGVDEQAYQRFERGRTIQVAIGGYRPWSGVQLLVEPTGPARRTSLQAAASHYQRAISLSQADPDRSRVLWANLAQVSDELNDPTAAAQARARAQTPAEAHG